jgi:aspartate/methionine/tyrosine aminotransferase
VSLSEPQGALYAFPNVSEAGRTSVEFSHFLLKDSKVLVVPGTEFGRYGEGYIRLSYATAYDKIEKALNKIEESLEKA